MIETGLLIALGFLIASILVLLFAGAFWRRAVRLTEKRIEATMPMSIADIQADKDQLRAEYAVELRRMEMAYDREREHAARYLVERNKHKVEINELKEELKGLAAELAERGNESTVLEQTVRKRIPKLEAQLERARQIIAARDRELARMTTAYENQTEAVGIAKKAAQRYQGEVQRLTQVLEAGGASRAKPAEGTLEEENQRLLAEVSRLRQELARLNEVEVADNALLRSEIQKLADQMMHGAPSPKAEKKDAPAESKKAEAAEEADTPAAAKKPARKRAPARKKRSVPKKRGGSLGERLKKLTAKADA